MDAQLRGADDASYYQHALAEQDFRNRRAKHIVYGHTHYAESVPLDASFAEGYVLNQAYFNSGTWRRVLPADALAAGRARVHRRRHADLPGVLSRRRAPRPAVRNLDRHARPCHALAGGLPP